VSLVNVFELKVSLVASDL